MRFLIQRVSAASVSINGDLHSSIDRGLLIFVGIASADEQKDIDWGVAKILSMRIFPDSEGKMNENIASAHGSLLVVSQFTLHASVRKGNRPSFVQAANPEFAKNMYEKVLQAFKASGLKLSSGVFGANMQIQLINDGPVTIWIDSGNPE